MPMELSIHADGALHPCRWSSPSMPMALSIHADGALHPCRWSSPSMPMELSIHADGALHPCRWSSSIAAPTHSHRAESPLPSVTRPAPIGPCAGATYADGGRLFTAPDSQNHRHAGITGGGRALTTPENLAAHPSHARALGRAGAIRDALVLRVSRSDVLEHVRASVAVARSGALRCANLRSDCQRARPARRLLADPAAAGASCEFLPRFRMRVFLAVLLGVLAGACGSGDGARDAGAERDAAPLGCGSAGWCDGNTQLCVSWAGGTGGPVGYTCVPIPATCQPSSTCTCAMKEVKGGFPPCTGCNPSRAGLTLVCFGA